MTLTESSYVFTSHIPITISYPLISPKHEEVSKSIVNVWIDRTFDGLLFPSADKIGQMTWRAEHIKRQKGNGFPPFPHHFKQKPDSRLSYLCLLFWSRWSPFDKLCLPVSRKTVNWIMFHIWHNIAAGTMNGWYNVHYACACITLDKVGDL